MKRAFQKRSKMDRKIYNVEQSNINKIMMHSHSTSEDLKKIIKQLQSQLKEERRIRKNMQEHFIDYQKRNIKREQQFFRIIQSLKPKLDTDIKDNSQIQEIYNTILNNFQHTNTITNQFLQEKYKKNYEFMERRITQILLNVQNQIARHKKCSMESVKQIRKQIMEVLEMAKAIQLDFSSSRKTIKDLEFKNQILKVQKNLLIQQVLKKKKALITRNQIQKTISQQKDQRNNQSQLLHTNNKNIKFKQKSRIHNSLSPSSRPFTMLRSHKKNSFIRNESTLQEPFSTKESIHQRTIQNLKNSLKRQKNKSSQLGTIVTKIQNKNRDINEALDDCLKNSDKKQKSLELFLESQKLFKTIKVLKRRLSMVQVPIISCGWDNQLDDLVITN